MEWSIAILAEVSLIILLISSDGTSNSEQRVRASGPTTNVFISLPFPPREPTRVQEAPIGLEVTPNNHDILVISTGPTTFAT